MAKNADGTVTLKTTGKISHTPTSGSGAGRKAPLAVGAGSGGGPMVRKQPGRGVKKRAEGQGT